MASSVGSGTTVTTIVLLVIGMVIFVSFSVWMGLRAWESAERSERDPSYRRKILLWGAGVYAIVVVVNTVEVVFGNEPLETLAGLPIVLLIIWGLIHVANKSRKPSP